MNDENIPGKMSFVRIMVTIFCLGALALTIACPWRYTYPGMAMLPLWDYPGGDVVLYTNILQMGVIIVVWAVGLEYARRYD